MSACCVCLSACVYGRWGRYALNSSAERRETQGPVNNSSNSILFLHDCSPALPRSTSQYNYGCVEELVKSYLQRIKFALFQVCVCLSMCKTLFPLELKSSFATDVLRGTMCYIMQRVKFYKLLSKCLCFDHNYCYWVFFFKVTPMDVLFGWQRPFNHIANSPSGQYFSEKTNLPNYVKLLFTFDFVLGLGKHLKIAMLMPIWKPSDHWKYWRSAKYRPVSASNCDAVK